MEVKNEKSNANGDQNRLQAYALDTKSKIQSTFAYFWNVFAAVLAQIIFRIFNKTHIEGRSNLKNVKNNTLLVSNHQTIIDSFFIASLAFWPGIIYKPSTIPWHPAALENFFQNKFLAFCSKFWKCIPIKRGARDFLALHFMIDSLKSSTMVIFPEGTRSRTGKIGRGKIGVGKLIYDAKPTVIPVAITGMNHVLPVGAVFPRIFKMLWLKFGEPLDLNEYLEKQGNKETSKEILNKIMDAIKDLKSDADKKLEVTQKFQPEAAKFFTRFIHLFQRIPVPFLLLCILCIYVFVVLVLI